MQLHADTGHKLGFRLWFWGKDSNDLEHGALIASCNVYYEGEIPKLKTRGNHPSAKHSWVKNTLAQCSGLLSVILIEYGSNDKQKRLDHPKLCSIGQSPVNWFSLLFSITLTCELLTQMRERVKAKWDKATSNQPTNRPSALALNAISFKTLVELQLCVWSLLSGVL